MIFQERYVLCASYLSHGEKDGREIGTASFIAQTNVDLKNDQKRCDRFIINILTPELSFAAPALE